MGLQESTLMLLLKDITLSSSARCCVCRELCRMFQGGPPTKTLGSSGPLGKRLGCPENLRPICDGLKFCPQSLQLPKCFQKP